MAQPVVEVKGLCKNYGGVQALSDVSAGFEAGRVHALLGENGAGKSTLIRILSGIELPTEGEIWIDGQETQIRSPLAAYALGISTVYQEPVQVMALSVSENIYAGRLPKKKLGFVDKKKLREKTLELMARIDIHIDPDRLIMELSIAQRQLVEILKAVSHSARFVIFDEPTSSLTQEETESLYRIIRMLRENGATILYISHRMEEIFTLCDTVTILRDGRLVCQKELSDMTQDSVIRGMVGRNVDNLFPKMETAIGEEVLRVSHLTNERVRDVSFSLRKGEILGFGGLVGAGRTEVARAVFGIDAHKGEIWIEGKKTQIRHPWQAIQSGIALVPEDRKVEGLVRILDIHTNISVVEMKNISRAGFLNGKREREQVRELIERLKIKTPSSAEKADNLSGGNQQKVVFAKWLTGDPKVLILDEPTRGVDVGAKSEIYTIMGELARKGIGIVMISSELPELMAMSDRILVMKDGRESGLVSREEFSEEHIMRLALKGAGG